MFLSMSASSSVSMTKWLISSKPSSGRSVSESLDITAILPTQTHRGVQVLWLTRMLQIAQHYNLGNSSLDYLFQILNPCVNMTVYMFYKRMLAMNLDVKYVATGYYIIWINYVHFFFYYWSCDLNLNHSYKKKEKNVKNINENIELQ